MPDFSLEFARDVFLMMKNFLKSFKIQTKYGTTAGAAASSIIISGIGLVLIYAFTQRKKEEKVPQRKKEEEVPQRKKEEKVQHVFSRSMSMGALHGGKIAMKRMLEYHEMRATHENQYDLLEKLEKMIDTDSPDFPEIQNVLAKLEMIGQEDKAIEILKKTAKEAKEKSLQLHEYEYQMLLVEALIYKGNIKEAEKVSCLKNTDHSDVRRSMYKTIIQLLLHNNHKAKEEWEEFKKIRSDFLLPLDIKDSGFYKLLTNFQEFKQVVDLLEHDIDEKKKTK